jgi:pyrroline-5-carboxylate reductase
MTGATLPPILLVGGGRMGGAMLRGWQERGLAPSVVVDPAPDAVSLGGGDVTVVPSAEAIPSDFRPEAVVLAVKPQVAASAVPLVSRFTGTAVVLSVMAGRTLAGLGAMLPGPIVRAMPNTPAAIGQGITAAYPGPGVSDGQRALCNALLAAVGEVVWVEEEGQLDAVTAVSGSGPAYVFLLAELLEQAGKEQGLSPDLARRLARATVSGSGALLAASGEDAAALRRAVTSPAGTTERALAVLMDPAAWPRSVSQAVEAAAARSRELAG